MAFSDCVCFSLRQIVFLSFQKQVSSTKKSNAIHTRQPHLVPRKRRCMVLGHCGCLSSEASDDTANPMGKTGQRREYKGVRATGAFCMHLLILWVRFGVYRGRLSFFERQRHSCSPPKALTINTEKTSELVLAIGFHALQGTEEGSGLGSLKSASCGRP